jgi:hypothetical protein
MLYVGSLDHRLYAVDAGKGRPRWEHEVGGGIATTPAWVEGLVVFGTNDGYLYALDGESGTSVWRYALGGHVLTSPLVCGDTILAGSDAGTVAALPWHLGHYVSAAERLERQKDWEAAAVFHALAGDSTPNLTERRNHYEAALSVWRASRNPERAARLCETVPYLYDLDEVAAEYERAASVIASRDRERAAALYFQAATCYEEAGASGKASACRRRASRLAPLPRLQARLVNTPPLEAGDTAQFVFDIRNYGEAAAKNVNVRLGGELAVSFRFAIPAIPGHGRQEIIVNDVMPLGGNLRIDMHYATTGGQPLEASQHFDLDVKPFEADIKVGGDAGAVILRLQEGAPLPKVHIKEDTGLIKVERVGKTEKVSDAPPPASPRPRAPAPEYTSDEMVLAALEELSEELWVKQRYSAIVLADERNIGQVGPGRYTRRDFPELNKRIVRRTAEWKAIVVDHRPFRMAFQLGPYRTKGGSAARLRFVMDGQIPHNKPLTLWQNALADATQFTVHDLVNRLRPAVANIVEVWLSEHHSEELLPSLKEREDLTVSLEGSLRGQVERSGLEVIEVAAIHVDYQT